jgi:hypothetical protein
LGPNPKERRIHMNKMVMVHADDDEVEETATEETEQEENNNDTD